MSSELIEGNGPCHICGFNQNMYAKGRDLKVPYRGELRHYLPLFDIAEILVTDLDGNQWVWNNKTQNWTCQDGSKDCS